ncbi:unnamed protein product [Lecanosticta acicola]|uniref:Unnamed protein product n=1 Tax=Lecanosticta acicola TaxID=111012 RepID=A0AAI8YWZ3_9PEZI|nr:unnamed protein product [Lecanosticta acicola]
MEGVPKQSAPTAQRSMGPSNPEACLLGLPRELRDLILEYILLKPTNTITMLMNFGCYANEVSARPPEICAVNRQLRAEALPAFYSGNTFTAQLDNEEDLETAKDWLSAIGDANVQHLRRLALCGWTREPCGQQMLSRRWVKVVFDLKEGALEVEGKDGGRWGRQSDGYHQKRPESKAIEGLKVAFRRLFDIFDGQPFDGDTVGDLMDGFNRLCTGY